MQVVGFFYACLVNASFALACEITNFLPPIGGISPNKETYQQQTLLEKLGSGMDGLQLMASFYISYASIRIVVIFATNVFNIALESIKDFPDLAKVLQKNRLETLQLAPNIFIPSLILELAIMSADRVCSYGERSEQLENAYSMILPSLANEFCHHTGLYFFTSKFPEIRRFVFVAIMVMVSFLDIIIILSLYHHYYQYHHYHTITSR